jgi:hypothetical protein
LLLLSDDRLVIEKTQNDAIEPVYHRKNGAAGKTVFGIAQPLRLAEGHSWRNTGRSDSFCAGRGKKNVPAARALGAR